MGAEIVAIPVGEASQRTVETHRYLVGAAGGPFVLAVPVIETHRGAPPSAPSPPSSRSCRTIGRRPRAPSTGRPPTRPPARPTRCGAHRRVGHRLRRRRPPPAAGDHRRLPQRVEYVGPGVLAGSWASRWSAACSPAATAPPAPTSRSGWWRWTTPRSRPGCRSTCWSSTPTSRCPRSWPGARRAGRWTWTPTRTPPGSRRTGRPAGRVADHHRGGAGGMRYVRKLYRRVADDGAAPAPSTLHDGVPPRRGSSARPVAGHPLHRPGRQPVAVRGGPQPPALLRGRRRHPRRRPAGRERAARDRQDEPVPGLRDPLDGQLPGHPRPVGAVGGHPRSARHRHPGRRRPTWPTCSTACTSPSRRRSSASSCGTSTPWPPPGPGRSST